MTALIVIFITLSLMGSALWVLPPVKERQRMALRMHARKLGLTVQLTSINLPDKWDKTTNSHKVAAYSYYRLKPLTSLSNRVLLLPYEVWKYDSVVDGWWSNGSLNLTEESKIILRKQGGLLLGVQITKDSVSFYWDERGDVTVLEELSKLVFSLVEIDSLVS
ncbi:hypothetical protein MUS1_09820 [Marinomonas ushuaiensis DSM 15871]|uniref:Uncharacterized protein n=1 Tax=Marinomonas ushuaiensis DSM 15871 TaxID=1122207 RepID=X7E6S6_9GAMM|nr:hypothetical protein [Marinomonas ushuaiensis]ETX11560.1 hypothetical protein MUS1_09820 [Marinomonas ushuaiensis DSM 15871]